MPQAAARSALVYFFMSVVKPTLEPEPREADYVR